MKKTIFSLQRWALSAILFLALQSRVCAHAFLDRAEPKVGSAVASSPAEIKLWFTQDIEPAFSSIKVEDAHGSEVDKKDTHSDPKNKSLLVVSLSQLPPGTYTVTWRVVSVDTHKTQGHFEFTIK